jgi:hypothetical protein
MRRMMTSFSWIIGSLIVMISSCTIETAKPASNHQLVIASDFLHAEDTLLFTEFSKKHSIRLVIRHLSIEEIIGKMEEKGFNSGIDMVLSKSMHSSIQLNNNGILHDLVLDETKAKSQNPFISYKHNFVGIGLDPFVFRFPNDTVHEAENYSDLLKQFHYHTLSNEDQICFFSPIRKERNRVQTYEWMQKWHAKSRLRPEKGPWSDSAKVILTKYSQIDAYSDSTWLAFVSESYFPNQQRKGVYFDVVTLSIVRQADHFSNAQKFMAHCQNAGYNATLNRKWHRFPIYEYLAARKEGPQFYPAKLDELLQYHVVLKRMISKRN